MSVAERLNQITESVIGAAIAVHRALGPGLLDQLLSYLKLTGCKVGLLINISMGRMRS